MLKKLDDEQVQLQPSAAKNTNNAKQEQDSDESESAGSNYDVQEWHKYILSKN